MLERGDVLHRLVLSKEYNMASGLWNFVQVLEMIFTPSCSKEHALDIGQLFFFFGLAGCGLGCLSVCFPLYMSSTNKDYMVEDNDEVRGGKNHIFWSYWFDKFLKMIPAF